MRFSTFILAVLPAAVYGITLYGTFDCAGPSTELGCVAEDCVPFYGNHSFRGSGFTIPEYIQTYETVDCSTPPTPHNFTAPPSTFSCVAAITGGPIGSYRCSLGPFSK